MALSASPTTGLTLSHKQPLTAGGFLAGHFIFAIVDTPAVRRIPAYLDPQT